MAKSKPRTRARAAAEEPIRVTLRYCAARFPKPRRLAKGVDPGRARLILENQYKWLNGTTVRYWFFDAPKKWNAPDPQKNVVRRAFAMWRELGVGLSFQEVPRRSDADIRIAFEDGDGSWSYIGTDVRTRRRDARSMNFGWSLTDDPREGLDTALHEIGHALGFPHEHQNPFSGIVWNEPAVYAALAKPPNEWSRTDTFQNIIEKIVPDTVQGSNWDPNSVMHYPFEPRLILEPEKYFKEGLTPAGGLSERDKSWAQRFYPGAAQANLRKLVPFQSVALSLAPSQQADFEFTPPETRQYEFRTFGNADTVMALFSREALSVPIAEDDDSGVARNAYFAKKLVSGRGYVLRLRLYYKKAQGETAVMAW